MRTDQQICRRDLLRLSSLGVLGLPASGLLAELAAREAALPPGARTPKSCILLYMSGGQSHIDTFDPKPENKTSQFKPIATRIPGVHFAEHLPRLAAMADRLALLRGMSTIEADHGRARYYLHTGYRQAVGGLVHPSLGAIVSSQLGDPTDVLPNFVSIDSHNTGRANGAGYAGPMHAPLEMLNPSKGVENLQSRDDMNGFDKHSRLFDEMERGFVGRLRSPSAEGHQAMYRRAAALMRSPKVSAFDLSQEPASSRAAYGGTSFGDGCLLARRLVESGVRFVEVVLDGWDTHQDNSTKVKELSGQLDLAMTALLNELHDRGRLDSTLVVCMGEFGRSPRLESGDGRGHYAKAWTSVLAGGGLKTGQVIGRTDNEGGTVTDRPIGAVDFMATICRGLEIDYTKHFTTNENRPVRIVDKQEKLVGELF
jgi:hypothetical protein